MLQTTDHVLDIRLWHFNIRSDGEWYSRSRSHLGELKEEDEKVAKVG